MKKSGTKKKHLFDSQKNIDRVVYALYAVCGLSVLLDFVIERPIHHPWEAAWVFYCLYGFAACVVLVLAATQMRVLLMRDEDYYEDGGDE